MYKYETQVRRYIMATKITNRKPLSGNLRSHALNATKTKRKLNKVTVTIDGKKYITMYL